VRWGTLELVQNGLQHAFDVLEHIAVPEANDAIPMTREFRGAERIGFLPIRVLSAVELDHQLSRWAGEVCDSGRERMLPTELPSGAPLPKRAP